MHNPNSTDLVQNMVDEEEVIAMPSTKEGPLDDVFPDNGWHGHDHGTLDNHAGSILLVEISVHEMHAAHYNIEVPFHAPSFQHNC
jgi:hypothetical protein